jgi:hypothetical protein
MRPLGFTCRLIFLATTASVFACGDSPEPVASQEDAGGSTHGIANDDGGVGLDGSTVEGGHGGHVDAGGHGDDAGPSQGDDASTADARTGKDANGDDASSNSDASTNGAPLVPAQGILLGHFYGNGTMAATDAKIGRKPQVHLRYYAWTDDWASEAAQDLADGRIPLVNWEPDGINFDDIIAGKLDSTITARAAGAKALGKPFFLDFAAEMNGDEAWGGNNPTRYIAAYRHIHDAFTSAGATNVVWAWCPNVTDVPGGAATMDYYPGDSYVDWTGVDGYNWGAHPPDFDWQSFHDVFADVYPKLAAKGKPILIGEMASDETGGDKAAWIDGIVPTLKSDFPLIKGLVWFDIEKEEHWPIDSSSASLAAYKAFAADPYTNP